MTWFADGSMVRITGGRHDGRWGIYVRHDSHYRCVLPPRGHATHTVRLEHDWAETELGEGVTLKPLRPRDMSADEVTAWVRSEHGPMWAIRAPGRWSDRLGGMPDEQDIEDWGRELDRVLGMLHEASPCPAVSEAQENAMRRVKDLDELSDALGVVWGLLGGSGE